MSSPQSIAEFFERRKALMVCRTPYRDSDCIRIPERKLSMTPTEYRLFVHNLLADQEQILERMYAHPDRVMLMNLDNGSRGLCDDCGEVNSCIKKAIEYGQPLDRVNLLEELGDVLFRTVQIGDAAGFSLDDIMAANVRKLKERYPDGYSDERAAEENRDRDAERAAVIGSQQNTSQMQVNQVSEVHDQTGQGWAEPKEEAVEKPRFARDVDYPHWCKLCHKVPVHKSSTSLLCPDCAQLQRKKDGLL